MKTLMELGAAVAARRRERGLTGIEVAARARITPASLSRFERGRVAEFGARKLLAVLAAIGFELEFDEVRESGSLDDLRRERGGGR